MITINRTITEGQAEALRQRSLDTGLSESEHLRRALEMYFASDAILPQWAERKPGRARKAKEEKA